MKSEAAGHPDRLLWHAAGRLDPADSDALEDHVGRCRRCSAELKVLRSMIRSVRSQERLDHLSAADLVACLDGTARAGGEDAAIRGHLRECAACREDLRIVRLAARRERRLETGRPAGPGSGSLRRIALGVGAACLAMAALALPALFPAAPVAPARSPARSIVFSPPLRLAGAPRALEGPGPWTVKLLLPFRAKVVDYRMRIRAAGSAAPLVDRPIGSPDSRGTIQVLVPPLLGPGAYVLSVEADETPAGETHEYAFDVRSP